MEANQLPTKPGPYYWRESDGGEWELAQINRCMDIYFIGCDIDYGLEETGGQWLPIPTAEELLDLRAKAEMVDDGFDGWAIYDHDGLLVVIDPNEPGTPFSGELKDGYTCEPVTIVRKEKNDTERRTTGESWRGSLGG